MKVYIELLSTPILINFKSLFLKITFLQSVMTSSMKSLYLKNAIFDFKTFCTNIELKEQPFTKWHKVNFELVTQLVPFDVLSHILQLLGFNGLAVGLV